MAGAPENIGPYRILETLGKGGMGVVYLGRHAETGELTAVKTVRLPRAGALGGIRREIHALARLRHPGIVRILAEGTQAGLPWYAMELLEGRILARHVLEIRPDRRPIRLPPLATAGLARPEQRVPAASADSWWTESLPQTDGEGHVALIPATSEPRAGTAVLPFLDTGILQQVLTLVRRLCAPLAFLHGEGLVHRDPKPENVVVPSDGQPVLVDFGLIWRGGEGGSRENLELSGGAMGTIH